VPRVDRCAGALNTNTRENNETLIIRHHANYFLPWYMAAYKCVIGHKGCAKLGSDLGTNVIFKHVRFIS